ncbi:MAG: hypothetical protein U0R21_09980 [Nocardioidaceae bacterium]
MGSSLAPQFDGIALTGVGGHGFLGLRPDLAPVAARAIGCPSVEPMLQMMNRGPTMESASIQLGLSTRTGRRRVTEAMSHYGVDSHFALGAAWAASRAD